MSEILFAERDRFPEAVDQNLTTLTAISRDLRRDRELGFYGAEDLTPSGLYSLDDAEKARSGARLTVKLVEPHVGSAGGGGRPPPPSHSTVRLSPSVSDTSGS